MPPLLAEHLLNAITPLLAIELVSYLPVLLIVVMAIIFVIINLVGSAIIGPQEAGATKGVAYESGMDPIGSTKKRFNIRFYMLAMTFLVFDVEIIFLYPWAVTFTQLRPGSPEAALYLGRILFFVSTGIAAYVYAWRKGVFRWE
ncbi:MAG: NADH-quinone oxidoreductase subunit A [Phycisphaerae bacterium]|nr:NADH-quinone oxidoreductase subunit A [Phycisphaerae bacterium]